MKVKMSVVQLEDRKNEGGMRERRREGRRWGRGRNELREERLLISDPNTKSAVFLQYFQIPQ
jgi:hypothetical protein